MNIFYSSNNPCVAAQDACDKHCVKMILETAQLLCTAHRLLDGNEAADEHGMYRATHKNHPCAVWARDNAENYNWLFKYFVALLDEYKNRYKKVHKSSFLLSCLKCPPRSISQGVFSDPPQCMPEQYKQLDTTLAYRAYLRGEKAGFARWSHSQQPKWWSNT